MSSIVNTTNAASSGAAVPLMLTELRLPTIKRLWADLAAQSNREGWPAERLLHTLLGHEMAERETRRLARARADSGLPPGKSLAEFDFAAVPAVSKAHVMALAEAVEDVAHHEFAEGDSVGASTRRIQRTDPGDAGKRAALAIHRRRVHDVTHRGLAGDPLTESATLRHPGLP